MPLSMVRVKWQDSPQFSTPDETAVFNGLFTMGVALTTDEAGWRYTLVEESVVNELKRFLPSLEVMDEPIRERPALATAVNTDEPITALQHTTPRGRRSK